MRNDIPIYSGIDGILVSHFTLAEFENSEGFVMLDPAIPRKLEYLRADLKAHFNAPIYIEITSATRTATENTAAKGSPQSHHLPKWGGTAVDFICRYEINDLPVPKDVVAELAVRQFPCVLTEYNDDHVHVDLRST